MPTILGPIVPNSSSYPGLDDAYLGGGRRSVASISARDAIPSARRKEGMEVYVEDTSTVYRLDADLTTWVDVTAVLVSEQDLTEGQRSIARQNMGAAAFFDAAGFPALASRGFIVPTGPYLAPAGGGTDFGINASIGHRQVAFVNIDDLAMVWNDTVIRKVKLFVPAELPSDCEVHVDIWRMTGTRFDLIGSTGDIRGLLTADDTVQEVVIPDPIFGVRMGDLTGGHLVYASSLTSWGAGFHAIAASVAKVQWAYSVPIRDGAPWLDPSVGVLTDMLIPIQVSGDSPVFNLAGDSRIDGYPPSSALTKGGRGWTKADPAYVLSQLTGLSARNEGRSGNAVNEMLARIESITASMAAYYVFCPWLYNGLYDGGTIEEKRTLYLESSQDFIEACLDNGGKVIVVLDPPFKDFMLPPSADTDNQNLYSDIWTGELKDIIRANYNPEQVLVVDPRPYMGQERPNTGSSNWRRDNLWDLKPAFAYGDSTAGPPVGGAPGSLDLVHWSAAGEEALVRAIVAEIRPQMRTTNVPTPQAPVWLANAGDADKVMDASPYAEVILPYDTTLTADRAVTLPPSDGTKDGQRVRVVRTGLGAFTLAVGAAKTIPSGTAATVEVTFRGGTWILTGYQPL